MTSRLVCLAGTVLGARRLKIPSTGAETRGGWMPRHLTVLGARRCGTCLLEKGRSSSTTAKLPITCWVVGPFRRSSVPMGTYGRLRDLLVLTLLMLVPAEEG